MLSPSALSQIELYLYLKVTSLIRYHVQIYRSVNRFHLGTKPELFHGHILSCSQIPLIYSNTLHPLLASRQDLFVFIKRHFSENPLRVPNPLRTSILDVIYICLNTLTVI